jgi:phosphoglycolate phosphatase-like HAD superfamily hydrolase
MTARPLIAHDLTEVRRAALLELSRPLGEERHVDRAMEMFFTTRSDVCDNFYEDTEACLEWFHSLGVKIGVLTNGSTDLSKCELLRKYLAVSFTAADIGAPKPSPVGFIACSQVPMLSARCFPLCYRNL